MNSSNKETDCFTELKTFRFKNPKNLIMGHLNINSLRNKFESIKPIISPNFDIFLVSETKLDESFPNSQFSINGYKMFRQERDCFGGGLCIYIKGNIASKQLNLISWTQSHNTNRNILNKHFLSLQKWFCGNYMVLKPDKCCCMSFGSNPNRIDSSRIAPKSLQQKM